MKHKINPLALYWASFNRFELRLPGQCVIDCSHGGDCAADVEKWTPLVREQCERDAFTNKPTAEAIRAELDEYGAWDTGELANNEANWQRLVWIAATDISEDDAPDCSAPVAPVAGENTPVFNPSNL